jgi:uncharacterized protein YbcV (DUF1398 family)
MEREVMNTEIINECLKASFADTPFPVVVQKLAGAGVTSYNADLITLRKTYYDAGVKSVDEALPLTDTPAIAAQFDCNAVKTAVKAIQHKEIGYADFLRRIMKAGCVGYQVFFNGRKAMYFSRDGEFYTEPFPVAAK